jgi:hypothetical protein
MIRLLPLLFFFSVSAFADTVSFRLTDAKLSDFAHLVFSDVLERSFIFEQDFISSDASVTVNLDNINKDNVLGYLSVILENRGFLLRESNGVYFVLLQNNEHEIFVYRPSFRSSGFLLDMVGELFGRQFSVQRSVSSSLPGAGETGVSRLIL